MLAQVDPNITLGYMILGYGIMWVISFLYVLSLANRQRNLRRDIQLMKRLLEDE